MLIGLPTSRFLMSISQFIMLGGWLMYGVEQIIASGEKPGIKWPLILIKKLFCKLKLQREALIFLAIIGIHFAGMLWTDDISYGIRDLRIKLPFLLLPIIVSTMPALSKNELINLLALYLFALFAASIESMYILFSRDITDIREISVHISHVRLALNFVLGIFITIYFSLSRKNDLKTYKKIISLALGVWFFLFLLIMKSPTGLIVLFLTSGILFIIYAFSLKNKILGVAIAVVLGFSIVSAVFYVTAVITNYRHTEEFSFDTLETHTSHNGIYIHDTILYSGVENGHHIGLYICEEELRSAWEERSKLDYHGRDKKSQELKMTLIRYLNSKGLRKDRDGIMALSDSDIRAIEGGVANYYYISKFSVRGRIYQMLFGIDLFYRTGDPNGNSMFQRREYWKAGLALLKAHPVIGVGTGDLRKSFQEYYKETDSPLLPEYRHRAHNQYLSIAIAFGIIGFIIFMVGLLYPPYALKRHRNWYFTVLIIIVILSFIAEDTMETQAGATFSAFFYCLFLWGTISPKGRKQKTLTDENT